MKFSVGVPATERVAAQARALLLACDYVPVRCVELGIPVTPAWLDFRAALRAAAVAGENLPVAPALKPWDPDPGAVPASVTPLQARMAINSQPGLRDMIEAYVATLSQDAQDAWEYATAIERDNPIIAGATGGLGMSESQIDDLFRLAAGF